MNGQRFLFGSPQTAVEFPGPGSSLASFRKPESLPRIQLPRAFILAARGLEMPSGELIEWNADLFEHMNYEQNTLQHVMCVAFIITVHVQSHR